MQAWSALTHRWHLAPPAKNYGPVGCVECRKTGFLGRTGIYEMLRISSGIRALIQPNMDLEKLTRTAFEEGMRPLRVSHAAQVGRCSPTIPGVIHLLSPTV